jgi:hypothetical protein
MQINKRLVQISKNMNTKYLVVVAVMAAMLVAATALATDSTFADKKRKSYEKSQAVSQVNDCGNGKRQNGDMVDTTPSGGPIDVWCQNTASQIQGNGNYPALDASQGSQAP